MDEIIVIVGPTGVGKTKLSIELAKKLDAEIINGDSVAIYRNLDIGSAKPSIEEREGVLHHLIDIKDVFEDYSVYDYQRDVRKLIDEIHARGKRIIIVGGTGLYIKAALYNYKFFKQSDIKLYEELSNQEIYDKICKYDCVVNAHVNNRQRLVRLLNKLENNEEISNCKDELLYKVRVIGLTTDRDYLYERINKRVDEMFEQGLLEEVKSFYDAGIDSKALKTAIGYKELYSYFDGDITLEEAKELIKKRSRNYAKRQYTWFNNQMDIKWFDVDFKDFNKTVEEVIKYIE